MKSKGRSTSSDLNAIAFPADWRTARLGDLLKYVDVRVRDTNNGKLPVLSIARHLGLILQSERFDKPIASRDIANYKVVRKGQIVCGFPMDEGVVFALTNHEIGAVSPAYQVWELADSTADLDFLDLLLKAPFIIQKYRMLAANVVQRRRTIGKRDFLQITIPVPGLSEQHGIAHVLRTVQRSKEATEKLIAAARELKKSLMRHLFTYGPVPVDKADRVPLKGTEFGPISQHWSLEPLGNGLTMIRNGLTAKQNRDGKGFPVTRIEAISDDQVDPLRVGFIASLSKEQVEIHRLMPGDILFSHINSEPQIGRSVLYKGQPPVLLHGMNLLRIRPHAEKYDPAFLNFFFQYLRQRGVFMSLAARAVGQASINQGKLKSLIVLCPPLSVQQEIAGLLETVGRKVKTEEKRRQALQALFRTLLHHLMTGKVRVKRLGPAS